MKATALFILLTAVRDRLFPAIIALIVLITGITLALSETAMIEEHAMHVAMSAGVTRIVLVMGVMLFVCFHIRAMFDQKEMDVILSRPVSRTQLVLGLWLGFAAVAAMLVCAEMVVLLVVGVPSLLSLLVWSASVGWECLLVIAIAMFASLSNKSAVSSVLISLTFYTLGRLMAFFVATANARRVFETPLLHDALRYLVEALSVLMPRLDLFADSAWLVYGVAPYHEHIMLAAIQTVIFIPFLLGLTLIDVHRKQF
ncbi:MAG: hypothetical protein EAZ74_03220 [Alphaproteobacteria bacterium]|nr:MAG: hypothetical protein EAY76_00525 [Alphaproteobacteria bacterium]TAF14757.1 MAG: hypothetical protein EAZ74_03220 [Alphaproteobacteria bacterium]TAF40682.1 MAG: hypothetical protein EAZ66_02640 [Alphaproteobacteria bacterium]TAF76087.1 MAG: hypothetical protein EAZ52_05175 [Alphaproteobacteria bacterium]